MNRKILIPLIGIVGLLIALFFRQCAQPSKPPVELPTVDVSPSTMTVAVPVAVSSPSPEKESVSPKPVASPIKKEPAKSSVRVIPPKKTESPAAMAPPPVKLFPELIPKDIKIVRVYYATMITGPSSSIEFDINGSGFTKEFEKMITVESGQPDAVVKNLALVTPNQIHGTLEISEKSATMVAFPRVLIQGKVVFQAPEPFAVIRPGEVLNLVFTEMGESGRSGRFRVFTNLTPEMYATFKIETTTSAIQVSDLEPTFPFIVDATVIIGPAVGGDYGIRVTLEGKKIWGKDGIIRVVKPNVGQSGLIQKATAFDGFHRPGDKVRFMVQGSGFQPGDVDIIKAIVNGVALTSSSFTYVSPGRVVLEIGLPNTIEPKSYELIIKTEAEVLQTISNAFRVVDKNWARQLTLTPDLTPGGKSVLTLVGRDLESAFVSSLSVEMDDPGLILSSFTLSNLQQATASISAGDSVRPGDYLLVITSNGKAVQPEFGSLIRVSAPKQ